MVLNLDGQLWSVVEFQHVKPGKGRAFVRTKLKDVLSGKVVDKTFNAGVKVETANVDKRDMQYLYKDGTDFVFMDGDTYDQIDVSRGDRRRRRRTTCWRTRRRSSPPTTGVPLYVELPASVVLEITYTEPGLQGDRSTGGTKPATLETGAEIEVPLFIEHGHQGQGRHPRRLLPGSRQLMPARLLPMAARTKARKRALDILFEAEQRGVNAETLLADRLARPATEAPLNEYTVELVRGRRRRKWTAIDELLSTYSQGWPLERMPAVDRAILRIGAYEVLYADDVPDGGRDLRGGALATTLSTDDSPSFVNGLLARIAEIKPTLV